MKSLNENEKLERQRKGRQYLFFKFQACFEYVQLVSHVMVHLRRWWFTGGSSMVAAQRGDKAKERSEKALIFLSILIFPHFFNFNFGLWGCACWPPSSPIRPRYIPSPSPSWPTIPKKLSPSLGRPRPRAVLEMGDANYQVSLCFIGEHHRQRQFELIFPCQPHTLHSNSYHYREYQQQQ